MQNISAILCIKQGTAYWSHTTGGYAETPTFTLGILGTLTIDLRQEIPVGSDAMELPFYDPAEFAGLALRFVMDVDYDQTTTPPLAVNNVTLGTGSSGETVLTIPIPDTNYVAMRTKLGVGQGIQFAGAVIGRNTSGKDVLYFEFPLVFRNNIDLDNAATEPDTEDPDWLPTIQANIAAIVEDMVDDLKGDPGDDGASAFDTWRAQEGNENGTEAEFLASIKGPKGDPGGPGNTGPANSLSVGTVTTLPAGSNATVEITGTAPNQTANFGIPRGAQGAGATFAYNITSDANSANWHPTMLATDRYWRISIDNGVSWSIARPLEQASVAPVARFSKIAQATNPTWQTPTDQGDGTSLLPSNCIYFRIKVEGRPWTEPALVGIPRDATTYPGVSSVADMTAEQLATWTATLKNDGGIRVAYAAPDETTGQQPDAEDADAWHAIIQTGDCYIRFSSLYGALRHVWTVSGGELASLQVATTGPEWHDTPLEDDKYMKLSLDGGTSWYGYFKIAMDADDLELVLDSTPTQGSANGVTSGGVYAAIQAATGGQSVDLSNYYTKSQADTLLQTKANVSHPHVPSDITGLAAALNAKQDALPSGTAGKFLKKTANGVEWDTPAGGGSNVTVDTALSASSENPVQNKVINAALETKQDALPSGGSTGDVLAKGTNGLEWLNIAGALSGSGKLPVVASEADMLAYAVGLDRTKEFGLCLYSGTGEDANYAGSLAPGHMYLVIGPDLTNGQVTSSASASGTRSGSSGGPPTYTYTYTTTDPAYEVTADREWDGYPEYVGTYTDSDGNGIYIGPTFGAENYHDGHYWNTAYYYYTDGTQLIRHHYDVWGETSSDPEPVYGVLDQAYDEVVNNSSLSITETTVQTPHEKTVVMHMGNKPPWVEQAESWAEFAAALEAFFNGLAAWLASIWCIDLTPVGLLHHRLAVYMLPLLPPASAAYIGASVLLTTDGKLYQCRGTTSNGTTTYAWQDVTPWEESPTTAVATLSGASGTVEPGKVYSLAMSADFTLSASSEADYGEAVMFVTPGSYTFSVASGITLSATMSSGNRYRLLVSWTPYGVVVEQTAEWEVPSA